MEALLECCCGIDIHKDTIEICILRGLSEKPDVIRQQFKTTKSELLRLASLRIPAYPDGYSGNIRTAFRRIRTLGQAIIIVC